MLIRVDSPPAVLGNGRSRSSLMEGILPAYIMKCSILSPPIRTRRLVTTQQKGPFSLLLLRVWP